MHALPEAFLTNNQPNLMQSQWVYILPFFRAQRWPILLSLGLGWIASFFALLLPISLGKYFSFLLPYQSFRAKVLDFLPSAWTDRLQHFLYFFAALILLRGLSMYGERLLVSRLGERLTLFLRERLFDAQLKTPLSLVEEKGIGRFLLRWSGDLKSLKKLFTHGIIRFVRDLAMAIGAVGFMCYFLPELALFILIVIGLCVSLLIFLRKPLSIVTIEQRNRQSGLLAFVSQRLRALNTIQALNRHVPENKRFAKRSKRYFHSAMRYQVQYHLIFSLANLSVSLLLLGLMIWTSFLLGRDAKFSEGENVLITFLLLISLRSLLGRLLRVPIYWELGLISLRKLNNILDFAKTEEKVRYQFRNGELRIKDLRFRRGHSEPEYEISSLHLSGKQTTCLLSTETGSDHWLVPLLLGLYPYQAGAVCWDGQVVERLEQKSLRRKISLASERFPLLGRNVFEAVSYSRKAEKRAKAEALLSYLQSHLLSEQQLQLNTRIGELGIRLNQHEELLLTIVRAFLRDKPILLWEIPFGRLCPLLCQKVVSILNQQKGKKTILIIGDSWPPSLQYDLSFAPGFKDA